MTTSSGRQSNEDRVVVVGPVIVDHYFLGTASRLDQTAPIPIVDVQTRGPFVGIGGGGNAANNLSHMAMPVAFVSVVGTDPGGKAFLDVQPNDLTHTYVAQDSNYQTPQKHRVYAGGRLVARFDMDEKLKANVEDKVVDMFLKCVDDVPPLAILVSDYDKGICTERTLEVILRYAREKHIKVIIDPVPQHMPFYTGAYIITPNAKEVCEATDKKNVGAAADAICKELGVDHCIVTCGADGMLWASPGAARMQLPALPAMCVDSCGAGDTAAAAIAYGVAARMPMPTLLRFAMTAGALSVERGGAGPVSLHQIHRRISVSHGTGNKRVNIDHAALLRLSAAFDKTIFGVTNGVFDLLHPGHVSLLEQAAKKCGFLAVLLNSDESAERVKQAPMQSYDLRAAALAAIPCVDAIIKFDEDTPEESIRRLEPNLLVKGPELEGKEEQIPGAEFVWSTGGEVMTTKLEYDIHTSDVRERIQEAADDREETDQAAPDVDSSAGAVGAPE